MTGPAKNKVIEAGFRCLIAAAYPTPSDQQIDAMRDLFFTGAHYTFQVLMNPPDPSDDIAVWDEALIAAIDSELAEFVSEYELKHLSTEGGSQ